MKILIVSFFLLSAICMERSTYLDPKTTGVNLPFPAPGQSVDGTLSVEEPGIFTLEAYLPYPEGKYAQGMPEQPPIGPFDLQLQIQPPTGKARIYTVSNFDHEGSIGSMNVDMYGSKGTTLNATGRYQIKLTNNGGTFKPVPRLSFTQEIDGRMKDRMVVAGVMQALSVLFLAMGLLVMAVSWRRKPPSAAQV